nr:hypothetical protein [Pseudomonas syringae]
MAWLLAFDPSKEKRKIPVGLQAQSALPWANGFYLALSDSKALGF